MLRISNIDLPKLLDKREVVTLLNDYTCRYLTEHNSLFKYTYAIESVTAFNKPFPVESIGINLVINMPSSAYSTDRIEIRTCVTYFKWTFSSHQRHDMNALDLKFGFRIYNSSDDLWTRYAGLSHWTALNFSPCCWSHGFNFDPRTLCRSMIDNNGLWGPILNSYSRILSI